MVVYGLFGQLRCVKLCFDKLSFVLAVSLVYDVFRFDVLC